MNWFVYACLSIIALSGSEMSQKISISNKANIGAVTNNFYVWLIQGVGGLILANSLHQTTWGGNPWTLLLVAILYFWGGTFFYTSYKSNSSSVSLILVNISIVTSTIMGILLFKESLSPVKFIGIGLILVSIVILNLSENLKLDKYNIFALIGGLCFGIAYSLDKFIIQSTSPALYVGIICLSVAGVSLVFGLKNIVKNTPKITLGNLIPIFGSGIFGITYNFFTGMSYKNGGQVGVIDALNNTSIFLIILMEVIFFQDRSNLLKKIFCAILATIGVGLLSAV